MVEPREEVETITVSMVEDDPDAARPVMENLAGSGGFEFIEWYTSGAKALEGLGGRPVSVLLLDLGLPDTSGWRLIRKIKELSPHTKIVVFTIFEDEHSILESIYAGADGYLLKDTPPELLLSELRSTHLGGAPMTAGIARKILKDNRLRGIDAGPGESPLTERQILVLNLLALGLRYADIGDELDITEHTVRGHIEKIYRKLRVHSKSDAIIKGRRMGIIRDPEI